MESSKKVSTPDFAKVLFGSPKLSIDRTFRSEFELPRPKRHQPLTKVAKHQYRNPITLAEEWQEALAEGRYAFQSDLARHLGASRARVTQLLKLLKLSPDVLEMLSALGDPLLSPIVTERSLRPIVSLPPNKVTCPPKTSPVSC